MAPTPTYLVHVNSPWTLIANPCAGRGRCLRVAHASADRLRQTGQEVVVRLTEYRGHGTELAAEAVRAQHNAVIVCGGDGTIAEVLPSLVRQQTALGVIPQGTGNDLARALSIPRAPASAVRLLQDGTPTTMDLGRCGDRWFATVAAFGFDAVVGNFASPYSAGSAYVLLHHAFGEVNGKRGAWGHAIGGMGAISEALAAEARHRGVEITTDCAVERVLVSGGRARGA